MKYVMLKTQLTVKTWHFEPFIFSNSLIHAEVAETMIAMLRPEQYIVHSAGFYDFGVCYGESSSLRVAHDPEDTKRIAEATSKMILGK